MYEAHVWWRFCKLWSFDRKLKPHYCIWIEFVVHCKFNSHGHKAFYYPIRMSRKTFLLLWKCMLSWPNSIDNHSTKCCLNGRLTSSMNSVFNYQTNLDFWIILNFYHIEFFIHSENLFKFIWIHTLHTILFSHIKGYVITKTKKNGFSIFTLYMMDR